jgi:F420-0:gamma-glutamyl ligase
MARFFGTVVRGVRAPIIRQGDDLVCIVADSLISAANSEGLSFFDRDVVAVTEAVVARSQGNYASVDAIASDIRQKYPDGHIGVIFPILSRNRFAMCLRGIARGAKKITLLLSYPGDEVGNPLFNPDLLDQSGINPSTDVLTLEAYRKAFGAALHPFTGVDYVDYYAKLIGEEGAALEIIFANSPTAILPYEKDVLCCDIHSRHRTKRLLRASDARTVYALDDILKAPVGGSGYHPEYGLLGSNKATEDSVKLFPRDCGAFVQALQNELKARTGKLVEVMVYGDGAFKDPVGGIWELADPVVSPGFTKGLEGTPNELKLKYLADSEFSKLSGDALREAIEQRIREKDGDLVGTMQAQGTTPRRLTDLLGSLCDLTSGSGDKGTPIVWIQHYFDNFAT